MKKTLLIFLATMSLMAYGSFAQASISVTGTSGTVNLSSTNIFDTAITLSISGTPPSNVAGVDLLLMTPASGINSGAPYFTVSVLSPSGTFPVFNNPTSQSISFDTTGTGPNNGFLISTDTFDLGANAGGNPTTNTGSNFNNTLVDTLRFTIAANTPAGTYNFYATGGTFAQDGTDVRDSVGTEFDLTSNPLFTITITIPEPATWSLMGLVGAGALTLKMFGRRRAVQNS